MNYSTVNEPDYNLSYIVPKVIIYTNYFVIAYKYLNNIEHLIMAMVLEAHGSY